MIDFWVYWKKRWKTGFMYANGSAKKSKTLKNDENILNIILSSGAIKVVVVEAVVEIDCCCTVVGKVYSSSVSSWPEPLVGAKVGCRHGVSSLRVVAEYQTV